MKIVYVLVIEDRHEDTAIYLFERKDVAIREARELAKDYCKNPKFYDEYDDERLKDAREGVDCVFYVDYSSEGDCMYVARMEVFSDGKEADDNVARNYEGIGEIIKDVLG